MTRASKVGIAFTAAVLLLISGCTVEEREIPPRPGPAEREAIVVQDLELQWAYIQSTFPGANQPEVSVQRVVSEVEWFAVVQDCASQLISDGIPDQDSAEGSEMDIANYICSIRYPPQWMLDFALSDAERGYLYDYYLHVLTPCLRDAGYWVVPPERETFIREYASVAWSPYNTFWEGLDYTGVTELQFRLLAQRCPIDPPGWGDRWGTN